MAREPLSARIAARLVRASDSYLLVLFLLFVDLIVFAAAGDSALGRVMLLVALAATLLVTLQTSDVRPRTFRFIVGGVVLLSLVGAVAAASGSTTAAAICSFSAGTVFILAGPVAIVRRMVHHPEITMKTVFGAMCIYLYVGILCSGLFAGIDAVTSGPFFAQMNDPRSIDYVYFSFVTMTTVGYGDLTSVVNLGRMIAVTEALFGQLYLVSAVAVLVGNLGHTVKVRGRPAAGGAVDVEEEGGEPAGEDVAAAAQGDDGREPAA
jgi:hypothetical protein